MIDDYLKQLKILTDKKKELESGIDAIKAQISKEMEENGIIDYKCSIGSISTVSEKREMTIDVDALRKDSPNEYDMLLAAYPKEIIRKSYVTYRFSKKEN